jgi:hypothetical protein
VKGRRGNCPKIGFTGKSTENHIFPLNMGLNHRFSHVFIMGLSCKFSLKPIH